VEACDQLLPGNRTLWYSLDEGARESVVVKSGSRPDEVNEFSSMYLILPAHSASNRNEYQKHKNNVSVEQSSAGA
jgi:hypothetical protein